MCVCCYATLLLAGLSLAAQEPGRPAENAVNTYSLEKEAVLGDQIAAEVHRHTTTIDNSRIAGYVNRLGRKISVQMPEAKFPFTFGVVGDDPCPATHEPVAVPGGYIFVPAPLFIEAHDEAEFASMLTHSMEHVAQRHATREATRGQIANRASIPLIFTGSGACPEAISLPVGFLAMHRNDELEADALAVLTIAKWGRTVI